MFCHRHPKKKTQKQCHHCWNPICENCLIQFHGKDFCSMGCIRRYYSCIFRLFIVSQIKGLRVRILRRKSWSAGLFAGAALSLILLILFGFVLLNPFSTPSELSPITEATVDIPAGLPTPFSLTMLRSGKKQIQAVSKKLSTGWENIRERQIKESVKIFLIKEYPSNHQKTVGISGQATAGSICALYLNDMLYEATTCTKGHFFFPRVALHPGENVIEVLVHDPEGFVVPSNTIELLLDMNRQITQKGINVTRGSIEKPVFCLTFDGGASASCAPDILNILERYQITCTFFLTGDFIRNHPDLVKKMVAQGHEIGNHSDTHPHLATLTSHMRFETLPWVNKAFVQNQIIRAEQAFFNVTGRRMSPFWRAPYGEHNIDILSWGEEIGYTHVSWTCGRVLEEGLDSLDWVYNKESPIYFSAEEIREKIIHFGEDTPEGANGGIVLMHLATSRPIEDRIHQQLPDIIEGLQKRGYRLAPVSEVIDTHQSSILADRKNFQDLTKDVSPEKEDSKPKGRRRRKIPL